MYTLFLHILILNILFVLKVLIIDGNSLIVAQTKEQPLIFDPRNQGFDYIKSWHKFSFQNDLFSIIEIIAMIRLK